MFPPFYTDCGKILILVKCIYQFLLLLLKIKARITIGDGTLIGHKAVFATLDHDFDPQKRQKYDTKTNCNW